MVACSWPYPVPRILCSLLSATPALCPSIWGHGCTVPFHLAALALPTAPLAHPRLPEGCTASPVTISSSSPGDIGGQMGLFIGASILTILEILDYVYEVC